MQLPQPVEALHRLDQQIRDHKVDRAFPIQGLERVFEAPRLQDLDMIAKTCEELLETDANQRMLVGYDDP